MTVALLVASADRLAAKHIHVCRRTTGPLVYAVSQHALVLGGYTTMVLGPPLSPQTLMDPLVQLGQQTTQ